MNETLSQRGSSRHPNIFNIELGCIDFRRLHSDNVAMYREPTDRRPSFSILGVSTADKYFLAYLNVYFRDMHTCYMILLNAAFSTFTLLH